MNRNLIIVAALLIHSFSTRAELLPAEIKNTYTIFTEDARRLSPLLGIIHAAGGVLENTIELFPTSPEKAVLYRHLFHRISNSTFKQSISTTVFGGHASPKNVGKIAFAVHHFLSSTQSEATFLHTLHTMVINDPDFLSAHGSSLSRAFRNEIKKFLKALLKSATQDRQDETFKILTSIVQFIAKDKNKLHDYFVGLNEAKEGLCPIQSGDAAPRPGCAPIFVDDLFLTENKEGWLNDNFIITDTLGDYQSINNFELAAYVMLTKMQGSWVAHFLTVQEWATLPSGQRFPDCGEVSLLNLIRMLFGVEETKKLDLELMNKVAVVVPKVKQFFSTSVTTKDATLNFDDLDNLRTQEARDGWADVASNLACGCDGDAPNVEYLRIDKNDSCEIAPGFANLDNLTKALFGYDIKTLTQRVADEKSSPITVTDNVNQATGLGLMTFETADRGNFQWSFEDNHYDFRAISSADVSSESTRYIIQRAFELGYPYTDLIALIPVIYGTGKVEAILDKGADPQLRKLVKLPDSAAILYYVGAVIEKTVRPHDAFSALSDEAISEFAYLLAGAFRRIDSHTKKAALLFNILRRGATAGQSIVSAARYTEAYERFFDKFVQLLNFKKMTKPADIEDLAKFIDLQKNSYGGPTRKAVDQLTQSMPPQTFITPVIDKNGDTVLHSLVRRRKDAFLASLLKLLTPSEVENARNREGVSPLQLAKKLGARKEEAMLNEKIGSQ